MGNYLVATIKSWNIEFFEELKSQYPTHRFMLVTNKEKLTKECLEAFQPNYIFFPHWSWIIPPSIYENYNCVVFHMTDLPFGRGGSPLQNLIVRGIYDTRISAIRVSKGVDTGDIFFKEDFDISTGSADEILRRASSIVFDAMIPRFIDESPESVPQEGEVVEFKRRTPDQSEIPDGLSPRQIYDYIRMLDGEGYPNAYRTYDNGKIYYSDAKYDGSVVRAKAEFLEDNN